MISFIIPTWLAMFIGITAVIWLVSALKNIVNMIMYSYISRVALRELEQIKQATKDPKLAKSCAYAIYQIGKTYSNKSKNDE